MELYQTQIFARANLSQKGHKIVQDTHQDETSRLGQGPQSKSTQKTHFSEELHSLVKSAKAL